MSGEWPVSLRSGNVVLRPLQRRDSASWHALRSGNSEWLREWEATLPAPDPAVPGSYRRMIRAQGRDARAGRAFALGIEADRALVGQITLGGVAWGSLRSAYIGYWISQAWAGRGIMPTAVALLTDHAFDALRLHRIEINIRPENEASRRVVAKLGFGYEGLRRRYLHINGDWRDHLSFVMLAEERPTGGLLRYTREHGWLDQQPGGEQSGGASQPARDTGESVP